MNFRTESSSKFIMIIIFDIDQWKILLIKISIKDDADDAAAAVPLEMANVAGVFYVLCAGSIFALIFAFIVVLFETLKISQEIKVRF